jgi:hypothetical protein
VYILGGLDPNTPSSTSARVETWTPHDGGVAVSAKMRKAEYLVAAVAFGV